MAHSLTQQAINLNSIRAKTTELAQYQSLTFQSNGTGWDIL